MNQDLPTSVLEHLASAMSGADSQEWIAALGAAQNSAAKVTPELARSLSGIVKAGEPQRDLTALGARLTRLQQGANQITYDQAREAIGAIVRKLNQVRRWRLSEESVLRVAESALLLHLRPICAHCNGRKFELVPDAPHVDESKPCRWCCGSGNRQYPRRNRDEVAHVLKVLTMIQAHTELAAARKI